MQCLLEWRRLLEEMRYSIEQLSYGTLVLALQKQPPEVFLKKACSSKFRKIHKKVPVTGLQIYWKETLAQVFFCEFCKVFKKTFFTEHLRVDDSRIMLLLWL